MFGKKDLKIFRNLIITVILTLGLSLSLSSLLAAWTAPGSAPPQGNIGRPIFASSTADQVISEGGGLNIIDGGILSSTGGLVTSDAIFTGNVIIGDDTNNNYKTLYFNSGTNPIAGVINRGTPASDLYFGETTDTGKFIFRGTGDITTQGNIQIGGALNRGTAASDLYFGETTDTGKYIFRGTGDITAQGNIQTSGKIKSTQTADTDSADTVVTKSYVDSKGVYSTGCGWINGKECPVGDLMNGYSSAQVKCCGLNPVSCTETGWIPTGASTCGGNCGSYVCGSVGGTKLCTEQKTTADCQILTRSVACGSCTLPCGYCQFGYNCVNGTCIESHASCMTAGTKVLMADGRLKNIEELQAGDRVRGNSGINTVMDMDYALMTPDTPQKLMSINNGSYFISNNHPVLTTEGWRAYIPGGYSETYAYDLLKGKVGQLKVGDIILGPGGKQTEVKSLETREDPEPVKLFAPVLDGDHTFFANDLAVIGFVPDKDGLYSVVKEHDGVVED